MAKLVHERVGGQAIHVGNCEIWAGIFYLDSPTDYREFLAERPGVSSRSCYEGPAFLRKVRSQRSLKNLAWLLPILLLLVLLYTLICWV